MKKVFLGIISLLISTFIFCTPVYAEVNDFVIKDFQADFYLNKDSEGRSTLKTVEVITAEFPNFDQNHGIERAIPQKYDDHKVNLSIISVVDENDIPYDYSKYTSNDNLVLRIGDADEYVRGIKTYKITYTQRDVTKFFADTKSDEFYWDVNGTEWAQPFGKIIARLHLGPDLIKSMTGDYSCYYGDIGSSDECEVKKDGDYFSIEVNNLSKNQNVTMAFGFKENTFNPYIESAQEKMMQLVMKIYFYLCAAAIIFMIILTIKMFHLSNTKGRGHKGRGIIAPEYMPPKDAELMLSARIMNLEYQWLPSSLVDLAVRKNIRIIEKKEGILKRTVYYLEYVSRSGLSDLEKEVMDKFFATSTSFKLDNNKPDYNLASSLRSVYAKTEAVAKQSGYYEENKEFNQSAKKIIITLLFLTIFSVFSIIGVFVGITSLFLAIILRYTSKPLSQKGRALFDYLEGLKMYIKVAESERLKVLQSPSGAEKISIDVNDKSAVLKLYEKLLPYAVMFGMGKEWSKVLGDLYVQQNTSPDWYSGSSAFNSITFGAAMSSFSTSTSASSYSSPSSNSSSGGSSGGGFSGGGGGGGGGGGW